MGGEVVDKSVFRFLICGSVSEIFAIKVESCQKSRKILDNFLALLNVWGRAFQKLYISRVYINIQMYIFRSVQIYSVF